MRIINWFSFFSVTIPFPVSILNRSSRFCSPIPGEDLFTVFWRSEFSIVRVPSSLIWPIVFLSSSRATVHLPMRPSARISSELGLAA